MVPKMIDPKLLRISVDIDLHDTNFPSLSQFKTGRDAQIKKLLTFDQYNIYI